MKGFKKENLDKTNLEDNSVGSVLAEDRLVEDMLKVAHREMD